MAAARYWRAVALLPYGGRGADFALREWRLIESSVRVDTGATLTCTIAPTAGVVTNLQDTTSAQATWSGASVNAAGFALQWDFGAGNDKDIDHIELVAPASADAFPYALALQSSADTVTWADVFSPSGLVWPGDDTTLALACNGVGNPAPVSKLFVSASTAASAHVTDGSTPAAGAMRADIAAPYSYDLYDGGTYRLEGTVKEKALPVNAPLHRRVRLHEQASGRLLRETWSDATTGAYSFDYIRGDVLYYVIAFDYTGAYRGVVADAQTALPMTP